MLSANRQDNYQVLLYDVEPLSGAMIRGGMNSLGSCPFSSRRRNKPIGYSFLHGGFRSVTDDLATMRVLSSIYSRATS